MASIKAIDHIGPTEETMMTEEKMGLAGKAALLASNLAVMATLGFGTCLMIAHG